MDVQDHLSLDKQLTIEDQTVHGVTDRTLDRILDREEPEIDALVLDRLEHVVEGCQGHDIGVCIVRLCEQRLFGEGALGPEESDTQGCSRGHTQAG